MANKLKYISLKQYDVRITPTGIRVQQSCYCIFLSIGIFDGSGGMHTSEGEGEDGGDHPTDNQFGENTKIFNPDVEEKRAYNPPPKESPRDENVSRHFQM